LPGGSIILFLGEADTGMTTCAQQILYQGLLDGRPSVYFTTGRSWEDIVSEMGVYGWTLERFFEQRKMWFIDSFGMKREKVSGELSWDIGPANVFPKEFPRVVAPLGVCRLFVYSLSDVIGSAPFAGAEPPLQLFQARVRAI